MGSETAIDATENKAEVQKKDDERRTSSKPDERRVSTKPDDRRVSTKSDLDKSVSSKTDIPSSKTELEKKSGERPSDLPNTLDPVLEVNEASEIFDQPVEFGTFVEIPPKIFSIKDVKEPLTLESLNNAIYENGVINLCWPEIEEPVFETRTCFPKSYYTNSNKERLLLCYAESFRRQYHFRYSNRKFYRKPLLLQAPNECGLQKMVCSTVRATKLNYTGTNTWQGLASLVSDYFTYEPLTKPMLHPERIMSPYTALIRRAGNPFEIAHVLVSWLIGAGYDAYVVVGCAKRDTCMNIRYRTICPDLPDESEENGENQDDDKSEEEKQKNHYKLMPLPDFTSKYIITMEQRDRAKRQKELDRLEEERQLKIKDLEQPPPDAIDGWRTHAWVLILPSQGVDQPFFIEPAEGNAYPVKSPQYQQIDSIYNNENYYVNLQTLRILDESEWSDSEFYADELQKRKDMADVEKEREGRQKEAWDVKKDTLDQKKKEKKGDKKEETGEDQSKTQIEEAKSGHKLKKVGSKKSAAKMAAQEKERLREERLLEQKSVIEYTKSELMHQKTPEEIEAEKKAERKKKRQEKKAKEAEQVEEPSVHEEEEVKVVWQNLSHISYDLSDLSCWEHLLPGEPSSRRQLIGVDTTDKRTAVDTEKHLDVPESWVEKLDISAADYEQRYPGFHKLIHYKRVLLEKFSRYSQKSGIVKRVKVFEDYALTVPLVTYEYYDNRDDLMVFAKFDHVKKNVKEIFETGRPDELIKHTYDMDAPSLSVEANRTMEFKWQTRLDQLEKVICTPLSFEEFYRQREDLLESRHVKYTEGTKSEPKRQMFSVTEVYRRNHNLPANKDVWKRIFNLQENTIELIYHYAYNFVTNDNRFYMKSNLAETGGKILFYPEKTSGYVADPCGKPPRNLDVYFGLIFNMEWENETTKHVRAAETDIFVYLQQRYKELTEPTLFVSLFNTERNEEAQRLYFEQQKREAERAERETEAEFDPLQPYLARMFGSGRGPPSGISLTLKEATIIREQCINDFKTKQLARQMLVQERFDALNSEYKAKRLWYLANQFILTPEKESAYFTMSAELSFQVHSLEVRLTRHQDLSAPRFKAVEAYLEKHPLLAEYNKVRAQYKRNL